MPGRHVQSATGGRVRIGLAGLGLALAAVLIAAFAGPAGAASKTVSAQLSLSGLASADNPLGGSQIGVHPGDKVSFSAAGAPTAGLDKLGLSGLVNGLLSLGASFQVTADFSHLPGGSANTVLSGSKTATFSFPSKGSYPFTWSAQKVTLLGVVPINLDGNQLAQAGVKLNASNQYVGKIVSATNPPSGGLSVQLPGVKVAPSAPVVGQLPTITIPGVNLPTVSVSVPDLNPGSGSAGSGSNGGSKSGSSGAAGGAGTAPSADLSFQPPALTVPQQVVPNGNGVAVAGSDGGSGGGGFRLGVANTGSDGQLTVAGAQSGTGSSGTSTPAAQSGGGSNKTVDLASSSSSPSGQLPVLLAILAVITLAMVAGTYARLYLLGRKTSSS